MVRLRNVLACISHGLMVKHKTLSVCMYIWPYKEGTKYTTHTPLGYINVLKGRDKLILGEERGTFTIIKQGLDLHCTNDQTNSAKLTVCLHTTGGSGFQEIF